MKFLKLADNFCKLFCQIHKSDEIDFCYFFLNGKIFKFNLTSFSVHRKRVVGKCEKLADKCTIDCFSFHTC